MTTRDLSRTPVRSGRTRETGQLAGVLARAFEDGPRMWRDPQDPH